MPQPKYGQQLMLELVFAYMFWEIVSPQLGHFVHAWHLSTKNAVGMLF